MGSEQVHPDVEAVAADIAAMEVRGAATIADAVAGALRTQAEASEAGDPGAFRAELRAAARRLHETRPTAVSLPNAIRYVFEGMSGSTVESLRANTVDAADRLQAQLDRAQTDLGRVGANRLRDGDTVMTHCHSTDALACIEAALDQGKSLSAIVKETRPRNQGHITAEQLREWDVPVTLVVDSAARRCLEVGGPACLVAIPTETGERELSSVEGSHRRQHPSVGVVERVVLGSRVRVTS